MKPSPGTASILNVDDNEIGRYTKTRVLRQAGFEVIEASNGIDALTIVREQRPQLVLLDLQLPDLNGFEICRRIRSEPASARTPVLHITATARAFPDAEATSVESGGDILLTQPIEPQELITVVRTLLRLRATEIGLAESEERMRLATEGAGIATWELDLRNGSAHLSPQLYRLLGYPSEGVPPSWDVWLERIHPDDRAAVLEALAQARHTGGFFTHEHRIVRHDDGSERWLAPYGSIHNDEKGEPARLIGVVLDVSTRKRVEAEHDELLRLEHAARREAEDLARLKDEFLATLSHELRSPMSAILGWLHLIRSGRLTAEQHATAIETIERNAQLQNQLIKDLLDVSSVIAGKLGLAREPVVMREIIERAVQSVRLSAEAQHICVSCDVQEVAPQSYDAARMQQVFVNLLSNSIKFTPSGGRIDIRGLQRGEWFEVAVSDTGEGIAAEVLPYVFERFRQADGSTTRRYGGLGLGLAIVRHLVQLHGGSVAASSEGPGRGSTFTVRLPLAPVDGYDDIAPTTRARAGASAQHRRNALKGLCVLVTDDEPSARELMSQVLTSEGADVLTAADGEEATRICAAWQPTVVILDIGMPGEDGYQVLQRLRGGARQAFVAIAVTGFAREVDRARAQEAGFAAYVTKPYDVDQVLALISGLVATPTA